MTVAHLKQELDAAIKELRAQLAFWREHFERTDAGKHSGSGSSVLNLPAKRLA
jgi:hypothetical protein